MKAHDQNGFTLVELLAVMTILGLIAATLLPALGRTKTDGYSLRCLANLKAITSSVLLYSQDNHDLFPPNPDDGNTAQGYNWCAGQAGLGGADEFDPDLLRDSGRTLVAAYLKGNVSVFRCPADSRQGNYDGAVFYPQSPLKGKVISAARSVSMNQAVGTVDPEFAGGGGGGHFGVPNLPVNGPWLTGSYGLNNATTGPWRTYGKTSQVIGPHPDSLWLVIEESIYSLNDATFAMSVGVPKWVDYVGTRHHGGCVVSFVDGHCELHRWVSAGTFLNEPARQTSVSANDPDWNWLAVRTSARMR